MPWQDEMLPADLTVEHGGAQVALRDLPDIKNVPDIPTLAKNYVSSQSELGRRVRIPNSGGKPEEVEAWRKEHLPKLYQAGVIQGPPESPDKYEIARPESLPDGIGWSDEFAKEARAVLHKAGFTNEQVKVAMALHTQALGGVQQSLNIAKEAVTAKLQETWGDKYEENIQIAMRGADKLFGEDKAATDFFASTGILTHPMFLQKMFEIGTLGMEGNADISEGGRGDVTAEESEITQLMNILNDPRGPDYAKYNTKANQDKIDAYWKKKGQGQQYVIS